MNDNHTTRKTTIVSLNSIIYFLIGILCLAASEAFAHAPNENYVWINVDANQLSGRFEINKSDIEKKLGVNVDANSVDRLDGVNKTANQIQAYLLDNFTIESEGSELDIEFLEPELFDENEDYIQYPFIVDNIVVNNELQITNSIFLHSPMMKDDRLHRSLLLIEYNKLTNKEFGAENTVLVFSPDKMTQQIDLANPASILEWKDFLWQGVLHIWIGLDHVLFIIVLLLTTVLQVRDNSWEPQPGFRSAFIKTIKIITIFTIAHSITFSLAALGMISIKPAIVETIIAASIVGVAINNVLPRYSAHSWILIFVFGLFHGMGFASVMSDLQFRTVLIERILILFNVGVELGQLAIVVVVFPILFLLRRGRYYQRLIVFPISCVAAIVAVLWVLQRSGVMGL